MHMLLASQRLEEGKLRGLDTHLSYRIGLKTFSAAESRAAIGVPDAYELPSIPGSGYLKFDTSTMVRFKASYVSGPYRPAGIQTAGPAVGRSPATGGAKLFVPDYVEIPKEPEQPRGAAAGGAAAGEQQPTEPSELDVDRRPAASARARPRTRCGCRRWTTPNSLDKLLPPLQPTEDRGLSPVGFFGNGRLQPPVGLVDKPFEQRRDLLWADFSGAAGHAAVVGGPQSGKSMLLRR